MEGENQPFAKMPGSLKVDISKRPIDPKSVVFQKKNSPHIMENDRAEGDSTLTSIGLASPRSSVAGERKPLYS